MNKINITLLIILSFTLLSAHSNALNSPNDYAYSECELVAKDFRTSFGGDMVFIQPLKSNGAFEFSEYNGHWINRLYIQGNKKHFYFDWSNQLIFENKAEIKNWYKYQTEKDSEIYIISIDNVPFSIHYHY